MLSIGDLARESGVPATTLRYYDARGLLPAMRLPNGHRRYRPEAVAQLRLVRFCQDLGLPLDEIALLLGPDGSRAVRRDIAQRRLAAVEQQVRALEAVRDVLTHFTECTHSAAEAHECGATVLRAVTREEQRASG